jgi:molecular chaperone DnaK
MPLSVLIGRRFKDKQVQKDIKLMPFEIVDGKGGNAKVKMSGKDYSPEEVSAMILSKLKADAESYLRRICNGGSYYRAGLF